MTKQQTDKFFDDINSQKKIDYIEFFMKTRSEIIPIYTTNTLEEIEQIFIENKDTVFPVCEDNLDNIIGSYNIRNFLIDKKNQNINFSDLSRVLFIQKFFSLNMLKNNEMCVVVDDFGGTSGLITSHTIIETLAKDEQDAICISKDKMIVDAKVPFIKIKQFFPNLNIESKTIGGFVVEYLGTVPKKGDQFSIGDFLLSIEEANKQVVRKIALTKQPVKRI